VIDTSFKPIKQKKRRYALNKREAICKEVNMLVEVVFVRLVDSPSLLASPILIKK
jgi:hypothetical protein